jgi:2-polyprenyl-3-methyl-5-hydroxy-6-metoxy-1,4-benzoquinol methylase
VETLRDCPICGKPISESAATTYYPDGMFPGGVLRVVHCELCGISFLNPRLTLAENELFEDANDFYRITPEERERQLVALEAMLDSLSVYAPRREKLLDIGCNRGVLLAAAKRLGWDPTGVELSSVAADEARATVGVPVYPSLANVPRAPRGFDLVVAWHVLEHTLDPVGFLRDARSLLSAGGILALQVPSFDFVEKYQERGRLASIACAVHNFYLGEEGLTAVVNRSGLHIRRLWNSEDDLMLTVVLATSESPASAWRRATSAAVDRARRRLQPAHRR